MKAHQRHFWIPLTVCSSTVQSIKKNIFFFPVNQTHTIMGIVLSSVHKPTESAWKCFSQQKNLAVIFFCNKLGLYIVEIDSL
jgi:hypothetical protein